MTKTLKRAFTLVELVVVASLLGVFMTAVVMIIRPTQKHYLNITNKAQEENKCIQLTDLIDSELRYATAVRIVYSGDNGSMGPGQTAVSSLGTEVSKYPNYIRLSNNHRENIGMFDARGFAEKGRTGSSSPQTTILNKAFFTDFDYQFSISGVNTSSGQQSLSLKIDCTPMIVQANNVDRDEDRTHSFEETFKFMNLRNKANIGSGVEDLAVPSDTLADHTDTTNNDFGEIWIFYALPQDLSSSSGGGGTPVTPPSGSHAVGAEYDPKIPTLLINDGNTSSVNTVVLLSTSAYGQGFTLTPQGTDTKVENTDNPGTFTDQPKRVMSSNVGSHCRVKFGASGSVKVVASEYPGGGLTLSPDLTQADFNASNGFTVYIYVENGQVKKANSDPNSQPSEAVEVIVHYLTNIGDRDKSLAFTNHGTSGVVTVNGHRAPCNVTGINSDTDITVSLWTPTAPQGHENEASSIELWPGGIGGTNGQRYVIDGQHPAPSTSGQRELWIYEGTVYDNFADVPSRAVGTLKVHYITDFNDMVGGFEAVAAEENTVSDSDGNVVPNTGVSQYFHPGDSFDVTFTGRDGKTLNLYWNGTYVGNYMFAPNVTWELWLYNGSLTHDQPQIPEWSKEMTIHYLGAPDNGECELRLFDTDTINGSSQINGMGIPNRNSTQVTWMNDGGYATITRNHNGDDQQHTLKFTHPDARVLIYSVDNNGNNGHNVKEIYYSSNNSHEFDDIWIYNGSYYATEAEARAAYIAPPAPGVPSAELVLGSSWGNGGNAMTGQPTITVTAIGGPVAHARVRLVFTRNVTNIVIWANGIDWSIDQGDTRVCYFDVYNIGDGQTVQFSGQITVDGESPEWQLVEITAESA